MTTRDALGARMKSYELETRTTLPERSWTLIRLDGRAFHTYLRGARKPFDYGFAADMQETAKFLCSEISGAVFAYTQSDEISILVQDFFAENTQPWFGGEVQKIISVSASAATAKLNSLRTRPDGKFAMFDSRVFTLPSVEEVVQYFLWRQQDCIRNSVSMAAQANFSHKELHGKGQSAMVRMLEERGIEFDDEFPAHVRFGSSISQKLERKESIYTHKKTGEEHTVVADRKVWWARASSDFREYTDRLADADLT